MQSHNPDMSVITGPQAHVNSVVRAMEKAGHQVRMVATQQGRIQVTDDLHRWRPAQFRTSATRPFRLVERGVRGIQSRLRLPFLRLFDSIRFSDACVSALADFDVLYERYGFLSYGGVLAARRLGIPIILEVNGDIVEDYQRRGIELSPLQWKVANRITTWTYNSADHVIAVDEAVKERIVQRWEIDPAHVTVVQNGAEYDLFAAVHDSRTVREKFGLAPDAALVTFVGGFKPWHGADVLTQAFRTVKEQVPAAQLVFIGDGPEREKTAHLASEMGLNGEVKFTGRVLQTDVAEILSISEIAVAPYRIDRWRELAGLKVYDYLSAGKAIVASARNGRHPVLDHLETGYLVPPSDPAALAQALLHLLQDTSLRRRLGQNGQALARQKYTWDHTVARIVAICRAQIAHRAGGAGSE